MVSELIRPVGVAMQIARASEAWCAVNAWITEDLREACLPPGVRLPVQAFCSSQPDGACE